MFQLKISCILPLNDIKSKNFETSVEIAKLIFLDVYKTKTTDLLNTERCTFYDFSQGWHLKNT